MICYSIALFLLQHLVTYCKLPYCRITQSFKYYLFFFLESGDRRVGRTILFILNTKVFFFLIKKTVTKYNRFGEREHVLLQLEEQQQQQHQQQRTRTGINCYYILCTWHGYPEHIHGYDYLHHFLVKAKSQIMSILYVEMLCVLNLENKTMILIQLIWNFRHQYSEMHIILYNMLFILAIKRTK